MLQHYKILPRPREGLKDQSEYHEMWKNTFRRACLGQSYKVMEYLIHKWESDKKDLVLKDQSILEGQLKSYLFDEENIFAHRAMEKKGFSEFGEFLKKTYQRLYKKEYSPIEGTYLFTKVFNPQNQCIICCSQSSLSNFCNKHNNTKEIDQVGQANNLKIILTKDSCIYRG